MGGERNFSIIIEQETTENLFDGLLVAKGANLDWLSPLAPNAQARALIRSRVNNNYKELNNLRKSFGFQENIEVTGEIAIALLDEIYLAIVKEEVRQEGRVLKTARHEQGHAIIAARLGWSVPSVTVVANLRQGYLGLTEAVPPANKNIDELLLASAAISYGGALAAQMAGDEVRGIGADMASAQAKARIAVAHPYSRFSSEAEFLSQAQSLAHQILSEFGVSGIEHEAHHLLHKRTIT